MDGLGFSRCDRYLILLLCCFAAGCASPYYADRGAMAGGLTGAGVGALIGNANDNTAAGALIGGTVGALSGGMVGNALDEIGERNQRQIDARLQQQVAGSVTLNDVAAMTQSGLSEDVIIHQLRQKGFAGPLTSNDLIALKNKGTSDQVLLAMQDLASHPAPARRPAPTPVIVQEHHYGPPFPVHPRHYFSRRMRRRCPPNLGWHVALHN